MEEFFRLLPGPQPVWVRYGITIGMVLATFILRLGMGERTGQFGFILFVPSIVATALLFDRGTGFFATLSSAALISTQLEWSTDRLDQYLPGMLMFMLIGSGLVFVGEGLHKALARAYQAERDKDLLLQEMSHRVKNKFTMISSIIGLQSRGASPEIVAALNAVAGRVRVISDVHTYLQHSRHEGAVDMVEYLDGLCRSLSEVTSIRPITLSVKVDPIALDARRALTVGLVVNELVTNSFKYAFPEERIGVVAVQLKAEGELLNLCVSDDGIGCGSDVHASLGTRLVTVLASQLGGEVKRESQQGCKTTITFPR